jgi:hypothetical protein
MRALVAARDGPALEALFSRARDARIGWQAQREGGLDDGHDDGDA